MDINEAPDAYTQSINSRDFHPSRWLVNLATQIFQMGVHIVTNIFLDPLQCATEILVIFVLVVLVWLVHYHRERVIFFITGDANVHADHLDCLAQGLHCCCGTGEWTRYCCWGRNVVALFGQNLGILSKSVKISSIVVGDLPMEGRHCYYVCVECKTDPEMVTAVVEWKLPKIVHFGEVLNIRLRHSFLEYRLRITVRLKKTLGHEEICEVYFSPSSIMDFCDHDLGIMRFEMKPLRGLECETPPWISMKFSYPEEGLAQNVDEAPNQFFSTYFMPSASLVWNEHFTDGASVADFKAAFPLRDPDGWSKRSKEPDEDTIKKLYLARACFSALNIIAWYLGVWFLSAFTLLRYYVRSCYKDYVTITMAANSDNSTNGTVTLSVSQMDKVDADCRAKVTLDTKTKHFVAEEGAEYCTPDAEKDVFPVCDRPPGNVRPNFLARDFYQMSGQELQYGVPCISATCWLAQNALIMQDGMVFLGVFLLGSLALVSRFFFNCCMRQVKKHLVPDSYTKAWASKPPSYTAGNQDATQVGSWTWQGWGGGGEPPGPPEVHPPTNCTVGACAVM